MGGTIQHNSDLYSKTSPNPIVLWLHTGLKSTGPQLPGHCVQNTADSLCTE